MTSAQEKAIAEGGCEVRFDNLTRRLCATNSRRTVNARANITPLPQELAGWQPTASLPHLLPKHVCCGIGHLPVCRCTDL